MANTRKPRATSRYARQAAAVLGAEIKLRRRAAGWSERELAQRAGVARATVQRIENGDMGCSLGLVLEAAALVGVPLFASDEMPLPTQLEHARDKLALLPRRARPRPAEVYDDF